MDEDIKCFLNKIGLPIEEECDLENQLVPREMFLDKAIYKKIYDEIPVLKNYIKSSNNTCLHKNAEVSQRWPLLNITCLLYTSPSPRDRTRSRMPSSA